MRVQSFRNLILLLLALAIAINWTFAKSDFAHNQPAHRVKDINTTVSSAGAQPSTGVQIGNITYFQADDGVNGQELWRSDGSPAGTRLVKGHKPRTKGLFSITIHKSKRHTRIHRRGRDSPSGRLKERRHRGRNGRAEVLRCHPGTFLPHASRQFRFLRCRRWSQRKRTLAHRRNRRGNRHG